MRQEFVIRTARIVTIIMALGCAGFPQSASLSGVVRDLSSAVIPGAKVEVACKDEAAYSGSTNGEGVFDIKLKGGVCSIGVTQRPYTQFTVTNYLIPQSTSMRLDVALQCTGCELIEHEFYEPVSLIEMLETDSYKQLEVVSRPLIKPENSIKENKNN